MSERLPLEQLPVTLATTEIIDGLKYLQNPEALSDSELDRTKTLIEDLMTDLPELWDRVHAEQARRAET
ncbi:hypothetical protein MPC38_06630 [Prescottella equi]|uniref:hypothetical protein n=1 Tax=Rhodococcus hoagii TaxID=43767 RepID=UPI001F5BA4DC|nr:hypothetical protein [Prescottella equi]UNQ40920.1 hypothetical protein MPC38_06630 [Prescottella equi]